MGTVGFWPGKQLVPRVAKPPAQGLARCFAPKPGWLFSLPGPSASLAVLGREGLNSVRGLPPHQYLSAGSKRFSPGSGCGTCRHLRFLVRF